MPWHRHTHSYSSSSWIMHHYANNFFTQKEWRNWLWPMQNIQKERWDGKKESAGRTAWEETKRHLIWNLQRCSVIFVIKLNAQVVRFNMHQHTHPLKFNRNKKPRYWATVYTNVILPEQLDAVRKWARKVLKILYRCFFNFSMGWFLLKLWIFVLWRTFFFFLTMPSLFIRQYLKAF